MTDKELMMSRNMNLKEFANLLNFMRANCRAIAPTPGYRAVKYVTPVFDLRTDDVFTITFRGFGFEDTTLSTTNSNRELKASLYDRCMEFLRK
jgi:hypothetical protein